MHTFESFQLGKLTLKNRLVMAPMCMYSAPTTGMVQPFHVTHYSTRAYGGIGLVIVEATAVEPRGRITDHDLGIWSDDQVVGLSSIVQHVHSAGAKVAIQLAHAGRKSMAVDQPVAPSVIAYSGDYRTPTELTTEDVYRVIDAFRQGARRAQLAGFDGVEIHGAHGYLINEFISPLSNHRIDEFGGSLVKRARLLELVLQAVHEEFKGAIWVRVSAEEYAPEGHHIDETIQVLQHIRSWIDGVNVSSGGVVPYPISAGPLYQMKLASAIKTAGFTTIGGGIVTTIEEIDTIFEHEQADAVFLARELLRNPYFPLHYAKAKGLMKLIPAAYERGYK